MQPEVRYARGDEGYVAYAVIGRGSQEILFIPNWATNLETMWEEPSVVRYFERLAGVGRVICFDKCGSGLSDPVPLASLPTLEQWMDDARLAMDAAGSERAALIGDTEGGPMAMLFAATYLSERRRSSSSTRSPGGDAPTITRLACRSRRSRT